MADDIGSDLQAGANFVGTLTDNERKTAAYNALNSVYGPAIAYDPVAANNASVASTTAATAQDKIDASARTNAAGKALVNQYGAGAGDPEAAKTDQATQEASQTQGRMAAFRAVQILKQSVDPKSGSVPADTYQKVMSSYGPMLGMTPDAITQLGQAVTAPGGAQHLDPIAQALIGPTQTTGAGTVIKQPDGTNAIVRFDKFGNAQTTALPGEAVSEQRVDTGNVNAKTHQFVAQTGRINAGTNQFRAATTANNSLFGSGGATLPGGGGGGPGGGAGPLPGNGAPATAKPVPAAGGGTVAATVDPHSLFATLPPKGRMAAVAAAGNITQQNTQLQTTNAILDSAIKQVSPYTAGTGSTMANLPGTMAKDLQANLATLKANGQMAWIASMKNANGSIPGGRLLVSEAKNAESIFGAMENDQSPKQLVQHLQYFKQAVNNLQAHSRQVFQAQYGVSPEGALGQAEHANVQYTAPQQALLSKYGVH